MPLPYKEAANGIAAIGSITAAMKAQRALARVGLACEIVALSPKETKRGCAYGVSYPLGTHTAIRNALRAAKIPVSEYLQKGGTDP